MRYDCIFFSVVQVAPSVGSSPSVSSSHSPLPSASNDSLEVRMGDHSTCVVVARSNKKQSTRITLFDYVRGNLKLIKVK